MSIGQGLALVIAVGIFNCVAAVWIGMKLYGKYSGSYDQEVRDLLNQRVKPASLRRDDEKHPG